MRFRRTTPMHCRVEAFLSNVDKPRTGYITKTQMSSGLSMAGISRELSSAEVDLIVNNFLETCSNVSSLQLVNYRKFTDQINSVFTGKNLEKDPLSKPEEKAKSLIDKTRFQVCKKELTAEQEAIYERAIQKLSQKCYTKRILVKPFFDDAAKNQNSSLRVGHVTVQQFKQVIITNLGLNELSTEELDVVIEKFDDYNDKMVNYLAFSNTVDPDM